ncbi:hypothetical protein VFPPC_15270 [Pochonia chlamydosporia 170]|uniref:Uncharacterized protein n=1 Tax=Pochonia chlamydosporia 170 TaxID=1380566 RepID=A0A179G714_METCM|nr:hypothetical protein VFPPC_15270 [Pochonia chlamydosporia 170]OAQ73221.1 hypothetical protein VFPPC_15270 [Pochonia chlamydosporia 170]
MLSEKPKEHSHVGKWPLLTCTTVCGSRQVDRKSRARHWAHTISCCVSLIISMDCLVGITCPVHV